MSGAQTLRELADGKLLDHPADVEHVGVPTALGAQPGDHVVVLTSDGRDEVGAVGVTSGNFKYFDNFEFRKLGKTIGPEHIMASGALPPGFPSVVIDGEHYWDGGHWWGVGPGAHSHVGGVRWWNVKHPRAYAQRVNAGLSPALARELLDERQRYEERVLLQVRLAEGLPLDILDEDGRRAVAGLVASGLIDGPSAVRDKRVRLTLRGRLLTDTVVRALLAI